jgi:hypothetical protein
METLLKMTLLLHQAEPMPNVSTPKGEQVWRARYACVAVCVYLSAVMLLVIMRP